MVDTRGCVSHIGREKSAEHLPPLLPRVPHGRYLPTGLGAAPEPWGELWRGALPLEHGRGKTRGWAGRWAGVSAGGGAARPVVPPRSPTSRAVPPPPGIAPAPHSVSAEHPPSRYPLLPGYPRPAPGDVVYLPLWWGWGRGCCRRWAGPPWPNASSWRARRRRQLPAAPRLHPGAAGALLGGAPRFGSRPAALCRSTGRRGLGLARPPAAARGCCKPDVTGTAPPARPQGSRGRPRVAAGEALRSPRTAPAPRSGPGGGRSEPGPWCGCGHRSRCRRGSPEPARLPAPGSRPRPRLQAMGDCTARKGLPGQHALLSSLLTVGGERRIYTLRTNSAFTQYYPSFVFLQV